MKRALLASAVLLAMAGTASATSQFGNITIDGTPANSSALPTETNGIVTIEGSDTGHAFFADSDLTIHGQKIRFERNTGTYTEVTRVVGNSRTVIGGDETELIYAKGGDGFVVLQKEAAGSPTLELNAKNIVIEATGAGVWAQNNSESLDIPGKHTTVNLNAENISIKTNAFGVVAYSNSEVNLNGNVLIEAPNAIDVRGNSLVNINKTGDKHVVIKGDVVFETPNTQGDGQNSGKLINAKVNINLSGEGSSWTGRAYQQYKIGGVLADSVDFEAPVYHGNVRDFTVNISDGAAWNMTDDSFINTVAVKDGGSLNVSKDVEIFNAADVELSGGTLDIQGNAIINVNNLTGTGGDIYLAAVIADKQTVSSGTLTVKNAVASDTHVDVNVVGFNADAVTDAKAVMASLNEKIQVADGSKLTRTNTIVEGDVKGALTQEVDAAGNAGTVTETVNQKLDGYSSIAALSAVQWRHENDTLLKRMGELRDSAGVIGSWVRIYGSEQEYGAQSVTAKNTTVQVGADYDIGSGFKLGGAISYTDGSSTFDMGESDANMYGVALYGTWLADHGLFVDVIGKYSRLENKFTSGTMKGEFDNNALSLIVETGWHYVLNDLAFVEPSASFTYGRIMGDDFVAHNGVKVEQDDYDSLIGRLGVRSGFYFPEKKGNIYARVAVLHDFMGDMEATASKANDAGVRQTSRLKEELGDTWVEYGIGANFNLSKNAYTFVDLEKTSGSDVKENWKWTVGVRYAF